ncbi:transcription factor IIIB 90 kDa subunit isoform X2 [Vitis riparia]|uniref:transcription factor IIIB 90 kDa subunit isoform X2 n=1 Tax=Vitis riparia TaxID=96939 RepID=UPI00155AB72F|nr:transcription factor IIIB 90 kDa subunit isoform X2 [Vitis riparia]
MVWCTNCARDCRTERLLNGYLCCTACGKVVDQDNFSNDPVFVKNAAGQSQMSGNFVKTVQSDYSASRERTLNDAYAEIGHIANAIGVSGGDSIIRPALAFYTHWSGISLGGAEKNKLLQLVFILHLCKLLSLEEHPIVQKPVDPSLFIHRFAAGLPGETNMGVSKTALRIIASMKRDWLQTGRKPSGLCGAALYISALSYGLKCSKTDIVKIVHICEATLTKRLIEFENTESGSLTIEEFNMKAEELEKEYSSTKQSNIGSTVPGKGELLCEHKGSGKPPFAHGLCEICYGEFIKLSGGLEGGSEPPAFQRAERDRMAKAAAEENADSNQIQLDKGSSSPDVCGNESSKLAEPESIGASDKQASIDEGAPSDLHGADDENANAGDESESLSDIDDVEVDGYLHNEKEKQFKKIIWEAMNKEYLEEQAAKEAAAAAAKEAYEASFKDNPEGLKAAQELAAATAAAVAKSRKERQQKRAAEAKNTVPAQTAAEATRQMLTKKRLSSKINYDVLEKLFDDSVPSENPKKIRTESQTENNDHKAPISNKKLEPEEDDLAPEDEFGYEGDTGGLYGNDLYGEGYDYDDDYGDDGYY